MFSLKQTDQTWLEKILVSSVGRGPPLPQASLNFSLQQLSLAT
jgi:hypothetical protein